MKEKIKNFIRRLAYRTPKLGNVLRERQKLRAELSALKALSAGQTLTEKDFEVRLHAPIKRPYSEKLEGVLERVRQEPHKYSKQAPKPRPREAIRAPEIQL